MEIFFLILIGSLLTAAAIITSVLYLSGDNSPLKVWAIRGCDWVDRKILYSRWFWSKKEEDTKGLFFITYNPETQIYKAGCFQGNRDELAVRLQSKKRHKLEREFYLNEIEQIHKAYPDA